MHSLASSRWQPASDPIDSRYVGELQGHGNAKFGLAKAGKKATAGVSIDELKQQWGFKPWPADTEAEMN